MCNWKAWLMPGILTVAILAGMAALFRAGPVQEDLSARTTAAWPQSTRDWASVTAEGRDLAIQGTAPTPEDAKAAADAARDAYGVRIVRDATTILPLADPYLFSVRKDGSKLSVSGHAPNVGELAALLGAAAATTPGASVEGTLELARGEPQGRKAAAEFGLAAMSKLSSGELAISGNSLSVSGIAASAADYEDAVANLAGALPEGVTLGEVSILPPVASPYLFSARRQGGSVVLEGNVPDVATRAALLQAAGQAVPGVTVDDRLVPASGQPDGFVPMAEFAIRQLAHLDPAKAALEGAALSLSGTASGPDGFEAVDAATSGALPPGATLAALDVTPPAMSPYRWSVVRGDGGLVLDGFAPSAQARSALGDAAASAFPGVAVENRMKIASGVPANVDWPASTGYALQQLAAMTSGSGQAEDANLTIAGEASDAGLRQSLLSAVGSGVPGGMTLAAANVEAPLIEPFTWSVSRDANGAATLEGYVPDEATGKKLAEQAASLSLGGRQVADRQVVARGAPEGFADAALAALRQSARLFPGRIELSGNAVKASGEVLAANAADEIARDLSAGLPRGFTSASAVAPRQPGEALDPAVCQQRLLEILASDSIKFETGSARLDRDSTALLDLLSFTVQSCPQTTLEIGGHTDSDGDDEANRVLSEQRAAAVTGYLANAGVSAARLLPKGYGETAPVAGNDTAEGKARNRRIEFRIVQ